MDFSGIRLGNSKQYDWKLSTPFPSSDTVTNSCLFYIDVSLVVCFFFVHSFSLLPILIFYFPDTRLSTLAYVVGMIVFSS